MLTATESTALKPSVWRHEVNTRGTRFILLQPDSLASFNRCLQTFLALFHPQSAEWYPKLPFSPFKQA